MNLNGRNNVSKVKFIVANLFIGGVRGFCSRHACLAPVIPWLAFVASICLAHENGDNKGHEGIALVHA